MSIWYETADANAVSNQLTRNIMYLFHSIKWNKIDNIISIRYLSLELIEWLVK